MALPIIPVAEFVVKSEFLPGGKITMKPFTYGQETVLLQVKESENKEEIFNALRQVISECIVKPKDLPVEDLPTFLLEFLFLKLRERSNGETVEMAYRCNNTVDGVACGEKLGLTVDLRTFELSAQEGHSKIFEISDDMGIKLKYPTLNSITDLGEDSNDLDLLAASVESIYQGENVWLTANEPKEDVVSFLSQLPLSVKAKIQKEFFGKLPRIHKTEKLTCTKCGHVHKLEFEGLSSVFG